MREKMEFEVVTGFKLAINDRRYDSYEERDEYIEHCAEVFGETEEELIKNTVAAISRMDSFELCECWMYKVKYIDYKYANWVIESKSIPLAESIKFFNERVAPSVPYLVMKKEKEEKERIEQERKAQAEAEKIKKRKYAQYLALKEEFERTSPQ